MWKCSYRCEKSQYLSVFSYSFTKFFKRRKPIDHSPRKIGKHFTSEKKHVRKTEKPILPKWFTYTEWKDMGRFSRIWARVKDSSLAGLSGSNRRGWEFLVEIIPPEHMNLRWGLNLVSLLDSSHVSTIGFSLFSGWRNKEGVRDYQLGDWPLSLRQQLWPCRSLSMILLGILLSTVWSTARMERKSAMLWLLIEFFSEGWLIKENPHRPLKLLWLWFGN